MLAAPVLTAVSLVVFAVSHSVAQQPGGAPATSPNAVKTANPVAGQPPAASGNTTSGATVVKNAVQKIAQHLTISSRLRVRTDLMGQPLVGSGEYAQLRSSAGLLLRMELAIQAGQQATSVKQISDGRDLWEHWRIGKTERLNHVDLDAVNDAVTKAPAGSAVGASSSLASGGLPKMLAQIGDNFDFGRIEVKSGRIEEIPVWFVNGVWKGERLAKAAPGAVEGSKIVYEKLPIHLPHQVELVIGQQNLFPYRVTYLRYHAADGKYVLKPAVTTEFFHVAIDDSLDPTQFNYTQPTNIGVADRTDAFIRAMGIEPRTGVAVRPGDNPPR